MWFFFILYLVEQHEKSLHWKQICHKLYFLHKTILFLLWKVNIIQFQPLNNSEKDGNLYHQIKQLLKSTVQTQGSDHNHHILCTTETCVFSPVFFMYSKLQVHFKP